MNKYIVVNLLNQNNKSLFKSYRSELKTSHHQKNVIFTQLFHAPKTRMQYTYFVYLRTKQFYVYYNYNESMELLYIALCKYRFLNFFFGLNRRAQIFLMQDEGYRYTTEKEY